MDRTKVMNKEFVNNLFLTNIKGFFKKSEKHLSVYYVDYSSEE